VGRVDVRSGVVRSPLQIQASKPSFEVIVNRLVADELSAAGQGKKVVARHLGMGVAVAKVTGVQQGDKQGLSAHQALSAPPQQQLPLGPVRAAGLARLAVGPGQTQTGMPKPQAVAKTNVVVPSQDADGDKGDGGLRAVPEFGQRGPTEAKVGVPAALAQLGNIKSEQVRVGPGAAPIQVSRRYKAQAPQVNGATGAPGSEQKGAAQQAGQQAAVSAVGIRAAVQSVATQAVVEVVGGAGQVEEVDVARPIAAAEPGQFTQVSQSDPDQDVPVVDQVVRPLQGGPARVGQQMIVRLNPPELGRVRLTLRAEGSDIRGVVEVENSRVLSELQRDAGQLAARLADGGVQLRRLEFVMNDSAGRGAPEGDSGSLLRDGQADPRQNDGGQFAGDGGDEAAVGDGAAGAEEWPPEQVEPALMTDQSINVWI